MNMRHRFVQLRHDDVTSADRRSLYKHWQGDVNTDHRPRVCSCCRPVLHICPAPARYNIHSRSLIGISERPDREPTDHGSVILEESIRGELQEVYKTHADVFKMRLVIGSVALVLMVTVTTAVPLADPQGGFFFEDQRWRSPNSFQAGETSATSVQTSAGEGGQEVNQGSAQAVSLQKEHTGPGGNVQEINNQAVIQALQQANDTAGGNGTQQITNNVINIHSTQLQQNVNGTLVNVQSGAGGVVIINADDLPGPGEEGGATVDAFGDARFSVEEQNSLTNASQVTSNQGVIQTLQQLASGGNGSEAGVLQAANTQVNVQATQQQENANGTLVHVQEGHQGVVIINTNDESGAIVEQEVINDRPLGEVTDDSATCRYFCFTPVGRDFYCCDFGSNEELGTSDYHDGACPPQRQECHVDATYRRCAFDSQCAEEDVCCYDACAQHHVCKTAQF